MVCAVVEAVVKKIWAQYRILVDGDAVNGSRNVGRLGEGRVVFGVIDAEFDGPFVLSFEEPAKTKVELRDGDPLIENEPSLVPLGVIERFYVMYGKVIAEPGLADVNRAWGPKIAIVTPREIPFTPSSNWSCSRSLTVR